MALHSCAFQMRGLRTCASVAVWLQTALGAFTVLNLGLCAAEIRAARKGTRGPFIDGAAHVVGTVVGWGWLQLARARAGSGSGHGGGDHGKVRTVPRTVHIETPLGSEVRG